MNKDQIQLKQALSFVNGRKRYTRHGKCVRCGQCCINEDCDHLSWLEDGSAFCLIHKEERPQKCKTVPQLPPIIFKTCGYSFRDLTNNRIIKPGEI